MIYILYSKSRTIASKTLLVLKQYYTIKKPINKPTRPKKFGKNSQKIKKFLKCVKILMKTIDIHLNVCYYIIVNKAIGRKGR